MNIETLVREAVIQETPFKSEFLQRVYKSRFFTHELKLARQARQALVPDFQI